MGQTEQQRRQYLNAMGVQSWSLRQSPLQDEPVDVAQVEIPVSADTKIVELPPLATDWAGLETQVKSCRLCGLSQQRTQTVFGVGNRKADWMVIGEAPGADEDDQGEPFVGRAGKLLNQMLLAVGLKREDVYIANIVKCRPPGNRDPRSEEVNTCEPYLQQQIDLIQPKLIFAVGRVAAQNLLKIDQKVGAMRGQKFEYGDSKIPVVVSYHPAYLLRSPSEKRKAWQDLLAARQILDQSQ